MVKTTKPNITTIGSRHSLQPSTRVPVGIKKTIAVNRLTQSNN